MRDRERRAVKLRIHLERGEGGYWVAGTPELEVYSQGTSPDEARQNAVEAITLFLESNAERGTLAEILERSGIPLVEASESATEETSSPQSRVIRYLTNLLEWGHGSPSEFRTFPVPEQAFATY